MKKKIVAVYVPHGSIPDGRGFAPAIVAYKQASCLIRWQPSFYSAKGPNEPAIDYISNFKIQRFSVGGVYKRFFQKITRLDPYPLHKRLAYRLRNALPDLLHIHQLEFPVAEFRAQGFQTLPIIVHAHVTTQRPQPILADRYIAVSGFVKEQLVQKGFPEEKITVISNGVDLSVFTPLSIGDKTAFRQHQDLPLNGPVLIFFGRKQLVKGFDIFLHVAENLLPRIENLTVVAIGPEPNDSMRADGYEDRLKQRARLTASGRFREFGAMPHEQLAKWIGAADVALLPSRSEPQGMAMLESMATGCLTISSAVGGIRESISNEKTGWLLPPSAPVDEWCNLVHRVITARHSLQNVADAAFAHVNGNHDWAKLGLQLEQLYDEVLIEKSAT